VTTLAPTVGEQGFWIIGVVVFLASGFGAYTVSTGHDSCEGFELSPATGGDRYVYSASGAVLLSSNTVIVGDWSVADGADEQGVITLGDDATIDVTIGSETRRTLSSSGAEEQALQVSYVATDPSREARLHVADEWLGMETGETIESRMPSVLHDDGEVLHHRHFTRTGWAGLMYTPDLWNRSLTEGEDVRITFRQGYPNTIEQRSQMSAVLSVVDVGKSSQGCQAVVDVDHPEANATVTLTEGVPVPTAYESEAGLRFEMDLENVTRGDGPSLSPINRRGTATSSLGPVEPLEDQFLADAEGIFSTDWPTALAAIEDDREAQTWLDNHPNAAVSEVHYVQGNPESQIENRWTVRWWPGPDGDSSMENEVTTRSMAGSAVLENEVSVDTGEIQKVPRPGIRETVTLPALDELHRRTYGAPLETIDCRLSSPPTGSKCMVAPHEDTGKPRAGGPAGIYHSGLIVDLRDRQVLQETSFAERLVDRPAQAG